MISFSRHIQRKPGLISFTCNSFGIVVRLGLLLDCEKFYSGGHTVIPDLGSANTKCHACHKGTHEYVQIVDLATGVVPNQIGVPFVGFLGLLLQGILSLIQLTVYETFGLQERLLEMCRIRVCRQAGNLFVHDALWVEA